jgi:hypothetical protein
MNMAAHPKAQSAKALRLASWNADGMSGRKSELDHILGKHGVDICLLTETHLRSGHVFRLANYVLSIVQTGLQRAVEQQYWSAGV